MSRSSTPSLDRAEARARWASERLDGLEGVFDAYWESPAGRDLIATITGSGTPLDTSDAAIPESVPILVGETIYHLRTVLDSLVYELAILDSGNAPENTQFPLEDSSASWEKDGRRRLMGLRPEHGAAIERLQPMRDVEWTRVLREISHPDTHRTFTLVEPRVIVPMGGGAGVVISATANDALKLDKAHRPRMVFTDRNLPVVDTLRALQAKVGATIDQFKPCFEGECTHGD